MIMYLVKVKQEKLVSGVSPWVASQRRFSHSHTDYVTGLAFGAEVGGSMMLQRPHIFTMWHTSTHMQTYTLACGETHNFSRDCISAPFPRFLSLIHTHMQMYMPPRLLGKLCVHICHPTPHPPPALCLFDGHADGKTDQTSSTCGRHF